MDIEITFPDGTKERRPASSPCLLTFDPPTQGPHEADVMWLDGFYLAGRPVTRLDRPRGFFGVYVWRITGGWNEEEPLVGEWQTCDIESVGDQLARITHERDAALAQTKDWRVTLAFQFPATLTREKAEEQLLSLGYSAPHAQRLLRDPETVLAAKWTEGYEARTLAVHMILRAYLAQRRSGGTTASIGDLVLVRSAGMERLAVVATNEPTVRLWRRDRGDFERDAIPIQASAILRQAPEGEQTEAARRALAKEPS